MSAMTAISNLSPYVANTSERGAKIKGPEPKPSRNVVTPRVDTVREQAKDCCTLLMAAVWIEEQKAIEAVIVATFLHVS